MKDDRRLVYDWVPEYTSTGICVHLIERELTLTEAGSPMTVTVTEKDVINFSIREIMEKISWLERHSDRFNVIHLYAEARRKFDSDYRTRFYYNDREENNRKLAESRVFVFLIDELAHYDAPYAALVSRALGIYGTASDYAPSFSKSAI